MSQLVPVPINPPPGVVVTETDRVAEGRWILPFDKIRFVHGRPQKIGGNTRVTTTAMSGTPRATLCWQDFFSNGYLSCGTYRKLYAFDNALNLNDITPIRASGTFGSNPFTTVNTSNVVTVALTAHGAISGDTVIIAGATAFNNVTMNGTFIVQTVVNANSFTILATTTANNSGSGGGASVTYEFEINVGTELGSYGLGWGVGPWGLGTWGTARASSILFVSPRVWSLDHFGDILCATYNGGNIWFFDPTQAEPYGRALATFNAQTVNGAPQGTFLAMFISPERFIFGLCSGLVVNVCSQGDPTTWTPATTNTAFARTLQFGTKLVDGLAIAPFISMVWSDSAAYLFQYTGSQFLYNSSVAGVDCGLISPNAAISVDGIAYWMGSDNFYMYNGAVTPVANVQDIRKYVFDQLSVSSLFQANAVYVSKYHEIWWYYTTTGNTNPNAYVIYHVNDQIWSVGNANFFTSATDDADGNPTNGVSGVASGSHFSAGDTSPYCAHTDGYIYNHDPASGSYDSDSNPMEWQLTLSPYALNEGDQGVDVEHILFDFFQQTGDITCTVNMYDRLTDLTAMDTETEVYPDTQGGLTDFRVSGRYLALSMSASSLGNYMRLGKPVAWIRAAGRRT